MLHQVLGVCLFVVGSTVIFHDIHEVLRGFPLGGAGSLGGAGGSGELGELGGAGSAIDSGGVGGVTDKAPPPPLATTKQNTDAKDFYYAAMSAIEFVIQMPRLVLNKIADGGGGRDHASEFEAIKDERTTTQNVGNNSHETKTVDSSWLERVQGVLSIWKDSDTKEVANQTHTKKVNEYKEVRADADVRSGGGQRKGKVEVGGGSGYWEHLANRLSAFWTGSPIESGKTNKGNKAFLEEEILMTKYETKMKRFLEEITILENGAAELVQDMTAATSDMLALFVVRVRAQGLLYFLLSFVTPVVAACINLGVATKRKKSKVNQLTHRLQQKTDDFGLNVLDSYFLQRPKLFPSSFTTSAANAQLLPAKVTAEPEGEQPPLLLVKPLVSAQGRGRLDDVIKGDTPSPLGFTCKGLPKRLDSGRKAEDFFVRGLQSLWAKIEGAPVDANSDCADRIIINSIFSCARKTRENSNQNTESKSFRHSSPVAKEEDEKQVEKQDEKQDEKPDEKQDDELDEKLDEKQDEKQDEKRDEKNLEEQVEKQVEKHYKGVLNEFKKRFGIVEDKAVGPKGDAVEAIFPEDMVALALMTSAKYCKGGHETEV